MPVEVSPNGMEPVTTPRLRSALQRVLAGRPAGEPVRAEILESWSRAVDRGLRPDRIDAPFAAVDGCDESLARAAAAVLAALAGDLAGTNTSMLVADEDGRIVGRWAGDQAGEDSLDAMHLSPGFVWSEEHVGTSGIGTALYRRTATVVRGDEHFSDRLTGICCVGAPIAEERSARVRGVIAIVRPADDLTGLMTAVARQAARDVERQLRTEGAAQQQLLREHLTVDVHDAPAPTPAAGSRPPGSAARFGWDSLTGAELRVAERVAVGGTNRQVAAELYLSRHTVDSHLRHIYTKLGIASRVQLTRLVMGNPERLDNQHACHIASR
jgi:DNA-binding CsgD family transcriptional regulator